MPIDLYYVRPSPPCRSVMMAAKALGIELNLKHTDLLNGEHLTPEFLKLNPQHNIPTMDDNGFVLNESRAIIGYLADQYGKDDSLYPKDPKKRAVVNQRLFFDAGVLFLRYSDGYYPVLRRQIAAPDEEKAKKFEEALQFLDGFLSKSKYAAGDNVTIADIALVASISTIDVYYDISNYKNICRWFKLCKETFPDYQNTNQAGLDDFKKYFDSLKNK